MVNSNPELLNDKFISANKPSSAFFALTSPVFASSAGAYILKESVSISKYGFAARESTTFAPPISTLCLFTSMLQSTRPAPCLSAPYFFT